MVDEIRGRTEHADAHPVRDDELRMMFTCAHPALDGASQLALTLRPGVRPDHRRDRPRAPADQGAPVAQ